MVLALVRGDEFQEREYCGIKHAFVMHGNMSARLPLHIITVNGMSENDNYLAGILGRRLGHSPHHLFVVDESFGMGGCSLRFTAAQRSPRPSYRRC